jgi:enterochelin esterase-like enzyme
MQKITGQFANLQELNCVTKNMYIYSLLIFKGFSMRRLSVYLLLACGVLFSALASAGEVFLETFKSEAIGRDYKYTVYLPDAYKAGTQSYPILYLLHGAGGDENEWLAKGGLRETMDAMIARRLIQPMVVVMPGHTGAWWVDGAKEKGETALVKEVMPHAEAKYRVTAATGGRLIAGLSAGGYGTLNLMMKYPKMFAAAAILSPAIYDPVPPNHSSGVRNPPFQKDGKFDADLWKSLNYPVHIEGYKKSGTIVPLYINSGDHDTFGIALQSATLYEKLRLHQPRAIEFRVVDGDHEWMVWRDTLGDALQFMHARLGEKK